MAQELDIIEVRKDYPVTPSQLGWVGWREGDAIVWAQVLRTKASPYPILRLPSLWKRGHQPIYVIEFEDTQLLKIKASYLLKKCRQEWGDDYFFKHDPYETYIKTSSVRSKSGS